MTAKVDLHQLIYDLVDQGKDPVLAGIRIKGNPSRGGTRTNLGSSSPSALLTYEGLAVFHRDKLVGWLNARQSKGYNYIRGNIRSTIVPLPCPTGDDLDIELIHASHRIKGKIVNGKPEVNVNVRAEGNIGEVECDMELATNEAIALLEQELNEQIKDAIEAAVTRAKRFKSDIFGLRFGHSPGRLQGMEPHGVGSWEGEIRPHARPCHRQRQAARTGSVVESFLERMGDS